MSAIARRVSTRSRNRTVLTSSSESDADVLLEDLVSPPPARASGRVRARGVVPIRGRRARVSNPRAARIQAPAPVVIPGQPATPPPIVVASPRPPPRVRRAGPRGGRRPQARSHNSPPAPPPPTPPRRVERVNAVPLVDISGTPAPPVAKEVVPAVKGSFECVVCMECLSAPATIMENNQNQPNAADNPGAQGGFPELGVFAINLIAEFNGDINIENPIYANFPRPGRRSTVNLAQINPRDIMTTPCGHMYHAYCIQKWFAEQG